MKRIVYLLALIVAGAGLCSGQTVLNGSFETGAAPPFGGGFVPATDSTTISGWTVQSGSVDYIGDDTWPAADGSRSLDMSGHDAGTITQNISGFIPGHQYRLSFYMAGNNDGSPTIFHLQANIGSVTRAFTFDATGYTYSNMGWSLRAMDFTATNTTMALTFTSLDDGNAGPALDNVSISPVPESCVSAPGGLVGWWKGEGNAIDAAGANQGTLVGGVTFAPGLAGQAFNFDGTNAYVEVADAPALRLTNELTIEFWVKRQRLTFPSSPYADYIVEKGGDWTGGALNYSVALHNLQYNHCLHFVFAGGWRGAGSIADLNWHHCAVVARHGQIDPTFYIDGVQQPVVYREGAGIINLNPSTRPLHIGAQLDPNTGWFYYSKTLVDELGLYNRALSVTEIQSIYNAGSAGKCTTLPPVNHPPVADASATKPLLIVPAGCSPTVVLDGSRSSDPDADPLQYLWFKTGEPNAFATGVVAVVTLPLGAHSITLVVGDGLATDAQTFAVELITPAQAVERLITLVNSRAGKPRALVATLSAALASIERANVTSAINQLAAFQNKVRAQVAPDDPTLAGQFIQAAQAIIDALSRDCATAKPHGKIGKVHRHGNGKVKMEFSAPHGPVYLVEVSTNLVDWEKIGVANECGLGEFEFEDPEVARLPARFYRIVSP